MTDELYEYLADHFGRCDLDRPGQRNGCYWGKPGCLKNGWRGRACPHWHPARRADLWAAHRAMSGVGTGAFGKTHTDPVSGPANGIPGAREG